MSQEVLATAGAVKIVITGEGAQFSAVVADAQRQLDKVAGKASVAGAAMKRAASEQVPQWAAASGAVRLLEGNIGNIVRPAERFIATTLKLGSALQAAFPIIGAISLGVIIGKMVEKIVRFREESEKAARESSAAWREIESPMRATNDELQMTNDKLADSIAKLEGKPRNGLKEAIDDAIVEADKLGDHLNADVEKISGVLEKQQASWMSRWVNIFSASNASAATGDITQRSRGLEGQLDEIDTAGHAQLDAMRKQGASEADIHAEMEKLAAARKAAIDAELGWANGELQRAQALQHQRETAPPLAGSLDRETRIRLLQHYAADLGRAADFVALSESNYDLTSTKAKLDASAAARDQRVAPSISESASIQNRIRMLVGTRQSSVFRLSPEQAESERTAQRLQAEPVPANVQRKVAAEMQMDLNRTGPQWKAYNDAVREAGEQNARFQEQMALARLSVEQQTGAITKQAAAVMKAQIEWRAYQEELASIQSQMNEVRTDTGLTDAQRAAQLQQLQNRADAAKDQAILSGVGADARTQAMTAMQELRDAIQKTAEQFGDLGSTLAEFARSGLGGFNETLTRVLTTSDARQQGRYIWHQFGSGLATEATRGALQYGEGTLLKGLLGKNPLAKMGTRDNPIWTKSADLLAAAPGAGSALARAMGAATAAAGGKSGAGSAVAGVVGSILHLLPGFAEGGRISSNMPSIVGENGPELFMPSTSGRIVPNDAAFGPQVSLGGLHVDARGAQDPAQVEAAVNRAMERHAPKLIAASVAAVNDYHARRPGIRR